MKYKSVYLYILIQHNLYLFQTVTVIKFMLDWE